MSMSQTLVRIIKYFYFKNCNLFQLKFWVLSHTYANKLELFYGEQK